MDYKKILEGVVSIINTTEKSDIGFANICSYIGKKCPELKESEEEKIRKWLILDIKQAIEGDVYNSVSIEDAKDALAWLEKQGEQKSTVIIPKFRIGDEIKTTNEEPLTITKIDEKGYWSGDLFICDFYDAAKWELAEQKPAWSEEDEKVAEDIEEAIINYWHGDTLDILLNWLKTLKQRIGG